MKITDYAMGMHAGIPAAVYHERVLGMASKSALDKVLQSPAHYRSWLDTPEAEPTPALAFGAAFHCAILEPDVFAATYATAPDFGDCRFKENKSKRAEWVADNAGRKSISADDAIAIEGMRIEIMKHPRAGLMMRDGVAEHTALWRDAESGLTCRARADYYVAKLGMLVDVKTTADASPDAFTRSVFNYGYHRQDALYRQGFQACGADVRYFVFVAVEKEPPYAVGVYQLDAEGVARGAAKVRQGLDTLALCTTTGMFPAYDSHILTINTPPWAA